MGICSNPDFKTSCTVTLTTCIIEMIILTLAVVVIFIKKGFKVKFERHIIALYLLLIGSICQFISRWAKYYMFNINEQPKGLLTIKGIA